MDGQFLWTADGYFQKDMDKQCGNYEKIWRIMDISIYFYGYDVEIIFENMDISMDISIYFYEQNMIFFPHGCSSDRFFVKGGNCLMFFSLFDVWLTMGMIDFG